MTAQILDHVERRLARLATIYRNSSGHKGVLAALAKQVQEIENAAFSMLALRSITDCAAAQLDVIAGLLGVEREGRDDAALRVRLRAQVIANSRSGEYHTLLLLLRLLAPSTASVGLTEYPPASAVAQVGGVVLEEADAVTRVLRLAKAAGVGLQLVYQTQADDALLLRTGDTTTTSVTHGLGSSSDLTIGGQLAAVSE